MSENQVCKTFLTFVILSMLAAPSYAQSPDVDVRKAVEQFFDGMREGDSTAVRAVIHPDARFMTTLVRNGEAILHTGSVDQFVSAVGTPHDEIWDEKIWNLQINVDDRLATAWMDYAFYIGDTFSHCGVNAFQFFLEADGWKVIQITDTRRKEGCELPDDLNESESH